jgi:hypothetical protein
MGMARQQRSRRGNVDEDREGFSGRLDADWKMLREKKENAGRSTLKLLQRVTV